MSKLDRLSKVELRDIWKTEASDFTPWLAQEENLHILGETIDIELELEAQEQNVGPFRADILCKDTADTDTTHWVLIENQLERTDHNHLGQLLTYAAGLQAVTIVWVAARFTDEHRAALDWLNDITDDRFRFFGLEIELWRIGKSAPAPKFNLISKPNDWTQSVGQSARRLRDEALTETQNQYLAYWTSFRDFLLQRGSPIRFQKPPAGQFADISIGRSGFNLSASIHNRKHQLGVRLYIGHARAEDCYQVLLASQDEIETELGNTLVWTLRKHAHIMLVRPDSDPADESDWPAQHAWLAETLERFDNVFRPRVKTLDPDDRPQDDGPDGD